MGSKKYKAQNTGRKYIRPKYDGHDRKYQGFCPKLQILIITLKLKNNKTIWNNKRYTSLSDEINYEPIFYFT